jgi:hypothetical protein
MVAAFGLAIARQRWRSQTGRDGAGSKGQRRPLVLPFLHQQYPGMMAIHLVRDGRDMAYANNQDRQRCLRHIAIGAASRLLPRPIQSTKFWPQINLAAARHGEAVFAEDYTRPIRELCSSPVATLSGLLKFMKCDTWACAPTLVHPPLLATAGPRDPEEIAAIVRFGVQALRRFDYPSNAG